MAIRFRVGVVLVFMLASKIGYSQYIGRVPMNKDFGATIMFPKDKKITNVALGSLENSEKGYYSFTPNEPKFFSNMIVFASYNGQSPDISFTLQLDDNSVWVGVLSYCDTLKRPYFGQFPRACDITKMEIIKSKEQIIEKDSIDIDSIKLIKRLKMAMESVSVNDLPAKKENRIIFRVENILTDQDNMYVHLSIDNRTSENFQIKGIVFKYVEGKINNIKSTEVQNDERMIPKAVRIEKPYVAAHTKEEFGYVLKMFVTAETGNLVISFNEKTGTRNTQLVVSANDLYKVTVIK